MSKTKGSKKESTPVRVISKTESSNQPAMKTSEIRDLIDFISKSGPTSGKKTVDIKSPMIGTFYRSGNPDSPPLASVGDKVTKGQAVCIIEAMKLFNEIESEVSGTIVKVMVENASPVEYDQVLFVVEPD
jgi:acetyl-CoA carboxylase biotin carboxyl carrier protein